MNTENGFPVCPNCQSDRVVCHPQQDSYDVTDPQQTRRFTTRAERLANPDLKIAPEQRCVYCPDHTWYTCAACKQEIPVPLVEVAEAKAHEAWVAAGSQPFRVYETIARRSV
jgi:hypothetical protein